MEQSDAGTNLPFPYLVVRLFATVYQRIPIYFVAGAPSFLLRTDACILRLGSPPLTVGNITPETRQRLIEEVQNAVGKSKLRMCIVWSATSCTYVEERYVTEQREAPSGGLPVRVNLQYRNGLPNGTISEIPLASGRFLKLEAFYIDRTYASLLEGATSAADTRARLAAAARRMQPLWGERNTYVIKPEGCDLEENGREDCARLPEMTYYAWLTSEPTHPDFCGSELVVVYFASEAEVASEPFAQLNHLIRDLPWDRLAQNFDF